MLKQHVKNLCKNFKITLIIINIKIMTNNYSTNSINTKIKTKKLIKNNIIEMLFFKKQFKYLKTYHPYHLVDPSPWPVTGAFAAFMLTTGLVSYMHKFTGGLLLLTTGFTLILYVMYL